MPINQLVYSACLTTLFSTVAMIQCMLLTLFGGNDVLARVIDAPGG